MRTIQISKVLFLSLGLFLSSEAYARCFLVAPSNVKLLQLAIKIGNKPCIKKAYQKWINESKPPLIDSVIIDGHRENIEGPMEYAASIGAFKSMEMLVSMGVSVDGRRNKGRPLWMAIKLDRFASIRALVELGANVNIKKHPMLHLLIGYVNGEFFFIRKGIVPISTAAWEGNLKVMKLLLNAGANPKADKYILRTAIHSKNLEVVEFLLKLGIDPKEDKALPGIAVLSGVPKMLEILTDAGVDIKANPVLLRDAVLKGNPEIVRMLTGAGIDVNHVKKGAIENFFPGPSALFAAIERKMPEIVELLVKEGVDVDQELLSSGLTALHSAAEIGDLEIVKILIENGAEINPVTRKAYRKGQLEESKKTPLDYALEAGNSEIAEFLISKGAKEFEDLSEVCDLQGTNAELIESLLQISSKIQTLNEEDIIKACKNLKKSGLIVEREIETLAKVVELLRENKKSQDQAGPAEKDSKEKAAGAR